MNKLLGALSVSAMVLAMTTNALADDLCEQYDVAGTATFPFEPDGRVTYGVSPWWEDDLLACYNTHLEPLYLQYFPRCDFDGSGQVEFAELLEMYWYVVNYPTADPGVYSRTCPVVIPPMPNCQDLSDIHNTSGFSLGWGILTSDGYNPRCSQVFVSYEPEDVAFFSSYDDCMAECGYVAEPTPICDDVSDIIDNSGLIHFGPGAAVLADGQCHSPEVSHEHYDFGFFSSIAECQAYCGPQTGGGWAVDRINQRSFPLDNYSAGPGGGLHNIYVLGTGIKFDHAEFENLNGHRRAHPFYDFMPTNGGWDSHGLGTWEASVAAGNTYGVAKDAQVHSVRVSIESYAETDDIVAGLEHILYHGELPAVVLYTYGGGPADPWIQQALDNLANAGFDVVTAAGGNQDVCDSTVASSLVVSATDSSDMRYAYAGYGPCVDIFAPGVSVTGAWASSSTSTKTITNMGGAAALVAGAVAHYGSSAQVTSNATPGLISNVMGAPNLMLYLN